jgi:hypothetical protein
MDFIETLTAIVKEVIKEPCQTIKEDRIEFLVERSDNYRDFCFGYYIYGHIVKNTNLK